MEYMWWIFSIIHIESGSSHYVLLSMYIWHQWFVASAVCAYLR